MSHRKRIRAGITLILSVLALSTPTLGGAAQSPQPRVWTHTSQADFMAAGRQNLDVRGLDALGTPLGYDADPQGAVRLRSRPGPFAKHPDNPIFDVGKGDAWDNAVVSEAKVVFDGQTYHLWYAARQRLETPTGTQRSPMLAGYATSGDGLRWTRHPDNPVMSPGPPGAPDANHVYPPYVLYDGEGYRMWYSAHDFEEWSINYAVSEDGATWERHPANPLMRAAHDGRWDGNFISEPSVLWNGQRLEMWYNGGSERTGTLRVGYAWSDDGLLWHKWAPDDWVLDVGLLGAWDDFSVARVHVIYDGERYQMFYEGHDAASWRLGYARSDDGVTWHKDPANPILDLGPEGAFDSVNAAEPYVIFDGQTYRLYYSGYDGDKYRIGLAEAPPVYEPEGVLVSPAVDGGAPVYWGRLAWTCDLDEGTDIRLEVSVSDDGQRWIDWQPVAEGSVDGENVAALPALDLLAARYLRYRATLTTRDAARSPVLEEVRVVEAAGDFTLEVRPETLSLVAGQSGEFTLALSPRYGFDGVVSLSVTGLPDGVTLSGAQDAVALPAEVGLSLSSDLSVAAGTHPLAVAARAGEALTKTTSVNLVVLAPTPTATPSPTPTPLPTPSPTAVPPTATPLPTPTPAPSGSPVSGSTVLVTGGVILAAGLVLVGFFVGRRSRRSPE
jgi:hypothetical protein